MKLTMENLPQITDFLRMNCTYRTYLHIEDIGGRKDGLSLYRSHGKVEIEQAIRDMYHTDTGKNGFKEVRAYRGHGDTWDNIRMNSIYDKYFDVFIKCGDEVFYYKEEDRMLILRNTSPLLEKYGKSIPHVPYTLLCSGFFDDPQ